MGDARNEMSGQVAGSLVQAGVMRDIHFHNALLRPELPGGALVGRDQELRRLVSLTDQSRSGLVVTGPIGGGVDSLVSTAARELCRAGRFPGGMLDVEFHGYAPTRGAVAEPALRAVLRALGARDADTPKGLPELAAHYRSVLEDHEPALIVLHDVARREEALPLLPAEGEHKLLVGSHAVTEGPEGTRTAAVAPIDPAECVTLLRTLIERGVLGDTRVADDPDSATRLVTLVDRLPLAVSVVAGVLVAAPDLTLRALAERLEARLGDVTASGRTPLRGVWDLASEELAPGQARVLRAMALSPRPFLDTQAVSAAAAVSVPETRDALHSLRRRRLIDRRMYGSRRLAGWYRLHPAIRHHAARRADGEGGDQVSGGPLSSVTAVHTYTVQPGDTLSRIGARFHVNWQEVAVRNKTDNPDLIYPGEIFVLR